MKKFFKFDMKINEICSVQMYKPLQPQFDPFCFRWKCPKCSSFIPKSYTDGRRHKCKVCGAILKDYFSK